jgi:predicted ester cyclase
MARDEITDERAEELKRHVERGFNERDPKLIEELLADHVVDHTQLLGGVDLRQRTARVLEAFEDAELTIDDYISQGNAVAWRWTIRGTHSRRIMGMEPTGKRVAVSGLSAAVIRKGKILEFSDDAGSWPSSRPTDSRIQLQVARSETPAARRAS